MHCARRRVSEANRAAGPALRPEIVPRTLRRRKYPRADMESTPTKRQRLRADTAPPLHGLPALRRGGGGGAGTKM